jgi:predicted dehydrogenase
VSTEQRVLLVGLGTIGQVHLDVLRRRPDVALVGGVDPAADASDVPVFRRLSEALAAELAPDLVVVATPTPTHVDLVRQVVDETEALVLSEKPLATSLPEIESLADVAARVRVAHHFAFSPEVAWARGHVTQAGWDRPTRVVSTFNDAYAALPASRLDSLVSSWVDSAPNQLSLLAPFVDSGEVVAHEALRHRSATVLTHAGGRTVLTSNWFAADTSKQTLIEYDGDRQVRLDHTSMTAVALESGVVAEHVGYAGSLDRKQAHYQGLYDVLLADPADPRLGVPLAAEIARLLQDAESVSPGTTVWSQVGEG